MIPFTNPRMRMYALWTSAVEQHLRTLHPELSAQELRQLPMMQGVYLHVRTHERGQVIARAEHPEQLTEVERSAYLSQSFLAFGTITALATRSDSAYEAFTSFVDSFDEEFGWRPFSTDDVLGFSLCLILWCSYEISDLEGRRLVLVQKAIETFCRVLQVPDPGMAAIDMALDALRSRFPDFQYRNPPAGYGAQRMNDDARVVMLGDWGTSLDDAEALLEAVWEWTYDQDASREIVFVHLGDIYYAGLPVECRQNFLDVFDRVYRNLQQRHPQLQRPRIYIIPGNHEYYSYGYGFFETVDTLADDNAYAFPATGQLASFFCLRTRDSRWQFVAMDTGQDDHNALEATLQSAQGLLEPFLDLYIETKVPWPLDRWVEQWVHSAIQDAIGPFAPQLREEELAWHQQRIQETAGVAGQTILMSHHQGFSSSVQIDHDAPQSMNLGLMKSFQSHFQPSIAAWFWGHEHSFAPYRDGSFGLNKARLLGSSSYEASEKADHPYEVQYSQVSVSPDFPHATLQADGFYEHAVAVFDLQRASPAAPIEVTYFQYPSWDLDAAPPPGATLESLGSEQLSFLRAAAPKDFWAGPYAVDNGSAETLGRPAMTRLGSMLYMTWKDDSHAGICWATRDIDTYDPVTKAWPNWTYPGYIEAVPLGGSPAGSTSQIKTSDSTGLATLGDTILMVYLSDIADGTGQRSLCWSTYDPATDTWALHGQIFADKKVLHSDAGPAVTQFGDRVYIAYRRPSDGALFWASYGFEDDVGVWRDHGYLLPNGALAQCGALPSLTANWNRMFLAYRSRVGSYIFWASYDGTTFDRDTGTFDTSKARWVGYDAISTAYQTYLETDEGLSASATEDELYIVFKKAHSHIVQWAACRLEEGDSNGPWYGNQGLARGDTLYAPEVLVLERGTIISYRDHKGDSVRSMYT